jgi:membrane-bound lytic murein transglycosylase B
MSYDKRRPKFFRKELYNALKIIDDWDVDFTKMQGSWAGAMGHFQFMPSTFNAYAVDFNEDGKIDIWSDFEDAAGSAANYLTTIGWNKQIPWGMQVKLPWNFDYNLTGYNVVKTLAEWEKIGVNPLNKITISKDIKASVVIPDGKKGQAYMVFPNFKRIMIWNRSENYALAVSKLADYVANSGKKYAPIKSDNRYALTNEDVKKVQEFANKVLKTNLKEDGILGSKTRKAVKILQKKAKMIQDGYPDYQLLLKIERYNPKIGFAVPVQPIKVVKK